VLGAYSLFKGMAAYKTNRVNKSRNIGRVNFGLEDREEHETCSLYITFSQRHVAAMLSVRCGLNGK
jgi:hypothetical protein